MEKEIEKEEEETDLPDVESRNIVLQQAVARYYFFPKPDGGGCCCRFHADRKSRSGSIGGSGGEK